MAGYSAEQVADLIASAVHRYMGRERGSVASSGTLIDLESGWVKISRRARMILSEFARDELPPPSIDVEAEREQVRLMAHLGEPHYHLSTQIRQAMAVRQLGRAMNTTSTREPFLVHAGPAHRGECAVCGDWLADLVVYRDPANNQVWCVAHGIHRDVVYDAS